MGLPALFIHQRSSQSEIISRLFTATLLTGAERTKTLINLKRALGKLAGRMAFSHSLQQLWLNSLTQSPDGILSYVFTFPLFIYLRIISGCFLGFFFFFALPWELMLHSLSVLILESFSVSFPARTHPLFRQ